MPEPLTEQIEIESFFRQRLRIFLGESHNILMLSEDLQIFMHQVSSAGQSVTMTLGITTGRIASGGQVNTRRLEGSQISLEHDAEQLQASWAADPRWAGTERTYTAADVIKLRGSITEEHTLARLGAERLWSLLQAQDYVHALGALTGNQAVQQVKAGLKAIYLSGWQVAADANLAGQTYPDQSLYTVHSVPQVVTRINNALRRCDQVGRMEGEA